MSRPCDITSRRGDRRDQVHQRDALGRRHARRRLVHQQQPRLGGQGDRQLEPLEIRVGKVGRGAVALPVQPDPAEQPAGGLEVRARQRPPGRELLAGVGGKGQLDVLQRRHRRKRRRRLEGAAEAVAGAL